MIVKVILGTMQNARKLVSIAESIPYDVELCYGRYVVNAKKGTYQPESGVIYMAECRCASVDGTDHCCQINR